MNIDRASAVKKEQKVQEKGMAGASIAWCPCTICCDKDDCVIGCAYYKRYLSGSTSAIRKALFLRALNDFTKKTKREVFILKEKIPLAIVEASKKTQYKIENNMYHKDKMKVVV